MSDDRDRVQAILALADRVARGGLEVDDFYESSATLLQGGIWSARRLLEALDALDAIDRLEGENEMALGLLSDICDADASVPKHEGAIDEATSWLWDRLNGGISSGEGSQQ